jgi:predicted nucleic acid-binding protein
MMLFLDASALAARYFGGYGSKRIRKIIRDEQGEGAAISSISIVTFSLFLRDLKADGVPQDRLSLAGTAFQNDLKDLVQIEVDACLPLAGKLSIRHALRLEPSIQLAAAIRLEDRLEWNAKALPPPLVCMVTLDPMMAVAAKAEGLAIAPPTLPPKAKTI